MKELDKRSSGSAFQVILSPNTKEAKAKVLLSPEKRGISLEEQKKKMTAAEERRKVALFSSGSLNDACDLCPRSGAGNRAGLSLYQSREFEMLKHFAEVREHEKEVLQKAVEGRNSFSKMTQENLAQKMEAYKENRGAQMAALNEKFKARVSPCRSNVCLYRSQSWNDTSCFLLPTGQEAGRSEEETISVKDK